MSNLASNKAFKNYLKTELSKHLAQKADIGSAPWESILYSTQLEVKNAALQQLFDDKTIQTIPSPLINEYRLKMEFVCSFNPIHEPHSRFGQRKEGQFNWVVDLKDFNLMPKEWFAKTRKVYDFLESKNVRNWDLVKFTGFLRYIVTKTYKDQAMLIFVTRDNNYGTEINEAANLALELGFTSIHWQTNDTKTDVAYGQETKFWRDKEITLELAELKYKVGPNTFFQNNISGFELLLNYVSQYAKHITQNKSTYTLYDLYCGVGTIGLALASNFKEVIGIELNEESISYANENKALNGIKNATFIAADLNKYNFKINPNESIFVVDPPRTGLDKKLMEIIKNYKPSKIIYISCNPVTQYQNLEELKDLYNIEEIKGFDLYPHTNHMESVAILSRNSELE